MKTAILTVLAFVVMVAIMLGLGAAFSGLSVVAGAPLLWVAYSLSAAAADASDDDE